jgi:transmembrane sensor
MPTDIDESASIAEQAVEWWLTLRSGELSASSRQEFERWAARSPECIAAYLRTALVVQAARSPTVRWPETTPEGLIEEAKRSLRDGVQVLHRGFVAPKPDSRRSRAGTRRWMLSATATVTALFAAIGVAWFVSASSQEYSTGFGERRSIVLRDGSQVSLNSESRIRVELHKRLRQVSLEAGEALFRVAQDPSRPFEVDTGHALVRDVGTEFNVDRRPGGTTITVITGRVAVTEGSGANTANDGSGSGHPATVLLVAADRLVIEGPTWSTPQHDVNVRAAVSWTRNEVIFEHTALSEAANEFNRYNRGHIEIEGIGLQRREVSGVFQTDNPQSFLTFLSRVPGVKIRGRPDGTHVVTQD